MLPCRKTSLSAGGRGGRCAGRWDSVGYKRSGYRPGPPGDLETGEERMPKRKNHSAETLGWAMGLGLALQALSLPFDVWSWRADHRPPGPAPVELIAQADGPADPA